MHPILRLFGLFFVFALAGTAWLVLAGVTSSRNNEQAGMLSGRVSDLWGSPQTQGAPGFVLEWVDLVPTTDRVTRRDGTVELVTRTESVPRSLAVDPAQSRIDVALSLDQRRKGLMWFPLYDVRFGGAWSYVHSGPARDLRLTFSFPDSQGVYDDFRFVVDGLDRAAETKPQNGTVSFVVPVAPGQAVALAVSYTSRGMDQWTYRPTTGVGQVEDFALAMTTDFAAIDFPHLTMSPSTREREGEGWRLAWNFERLVTGYGIGMTMPERIQPGELAAELSLSAPLSLGLFMLWIYVLGLLRKVEIHPINHLFLAGAFFAFNLLFAYTADHLPVEAAFALASVVSVGLVTSYLRLVVGPRFAFVEAGVAQLLYQVGFALAHFWDGFTGLTITVLGIVTLFALMQLTGRIAWGEALARRPAAA